MYGEDGGGTHGFSSLISHLHTYVPIYNCVEFYCFVFFQIIFLFSQKNCFFFLLAAPMKPHGKPFGVHHTIPKSISSIKWRRTRKWWENGFANNFPFKYNFPELFFSLFCLIFVILLSWFWSQYFNMFEFVWENFSLFSFNFHYFDMRSPPLQSPPVPAMSHYN